MTPEEKADTALITLGLACVIFGVIYLVSMLAQELAQL